MEKKEGKEKEGNAMCSEKMKREPKKPRVEGRWSPTPFARSFKQQKQGRREVGREVIQKWG